MSICQLRYQRHLCLWLGISLLRRRYVAPECSSNMWFVKPTHGDFLVQRISRKTFYPRAVEHQGNVDKERVDHLIRHVRKSMPCTGLQHFWCDGPNTETNPDNLSLWSHVFFQMAPLIPQSKKLLILHPLFDSSFC